MILRGLTTLKQLKDSPHHLTRLYHLTTNREHEVYAIDLLPGE